SKYAEIGKYYLINLSTTQVTCHSHVACLCSLTYNHHKQTFLTRSLKLFPFRNPYIPALLLSPTAYDNKSCFHRPSRRCTFWRLRIHESTMHNNYEIRVSGAHFVTRD